MATRREIYVYAHWHPMDQPMPMGMLYAEVLRGKEVFSFKYDENWLKQPKAFKLDPDLQLFGGPQYLKENKENFGLFMDSSPDRWGKVLMRRREAALALKEGRKVQSLFATDYLLGVYDEHRMGAIRFKEQQDGPFLNNQKEMAAPPWASLRELEEASLKLEREDAADDPEYLKWLNLLIAPGSSLGGARPKASILDPQQNLWIAKFPSSQDLKNVGAWEKVAHELAVKAGLKMAKARLQKFSGPHHTFLTQRFDRGPNSQRIHFASAMTLLGHADGHSYQEGGSYLELAEFILTNGADATLDLEEIWRRIAFSVCISNTDDHLRNHGFLLTETGWRLSPAFDINPMETGTGLSLNISEDDNSLNLDLAMEVAPYFRLTAKKAKAILEKVTASVKTWRQVAGKYKIKRDEMEFMSSAFKGF